MKKKIILRSLVGAPVGLAVSTMFTIAVSAVISFYTGEGSYYPVVPELIADCGNELNAVVLQAVSALVYGAAWGGASVIWEMEEWSILRQTVVHLIICSVATFPTAWFMRWMRHDAAGIAGYFSIFFLIYLCIWLSQYFTVKKKLRRINERMREL